MSEITDLTDFLREKMLPKIIRTTQVTVVRPADGVAYSANDTIADDVPTIIQFGGAARNSSGAGKVIGARFETNQGANTSEYNIHLFQASPGTIIADNEPWLEKTVDKAIRIGSINIPAVSRTAGGSDTAKTEVFGLEIPYKCGESSVSVFAQIETVSGFTPVSAQEFFIELIFEVE